MRNMHLDCVESTLLQAHGSFDLQTLLFVDLVDGQAARCLAPWFGDRHLVFGKRRRGDRRRPVRIRAGRRANVVQLPNGEAPMLVDGFVELDHAGNEPVIVGT